MEQIVETILQIPINQIRPSAHQARKMFSQETIQLLAESMDHEGLIQPITVRRISDPLPDAEHPTIHFELISGERRLRAAKFLSWETIPARVISVISEGEVVAKGMVENLQREDLNPIEEAEGFAWLNKIDSEYWTQERIAQVAGKERTHVTRSIGLLNLPEPIKENVRCRTLSRGHAIELLRLAAPDLQLQAAKKMEKLNVQQARRLVDNMLGLGGKTSGKNRLLRKSAQTAMEIAREEGLGQPDPFLEVWAKLSESAPSVNFMHYKTIYQGNWTWQFNLNLAKFWAMTTRPVSASSAEQEDRRILELRKTLAEWFARMSRELSDQSR